jgi:hypothetical protein
MRRIAGWVDRTDVVDFNGETSTLIAVWWDRTRTVPGTTSRSAPAARKRFRKSAAKKREPPWPSILGKV